ncbi:uncharacterized protein LOC131854739 [Achroia grisella]|uniref:uncharacterized protein LOC131854739 n=1 Tax=Achroia grisella TaxID=688607 RepID=UPI0027D248B4|nr:uncharacterized protein LOC131854739 [Achroia grisella]
MSAEDSCNLECIKDTVPVKEFVGPVKIVLVDIPKAEYRKRLWYAACITLANMFMGATTFTILCYTLCFKGEIHNILHIALCTIGYQLLIPSGILILNYLHGAAVPQKVSGRKGEHMFIQFCGLACAGAGTAIVVLLAGFNFTTHSMAGLAAGGLAALTALTGPLAYLGTEDSSCSSIIRGIHVILGVPAFVASSVCFILGIRKEVFANWVPLPDMVNLLTIFCAFYTLVIILKPLQTLFSKKDKTPEVDARAPSDMCCDERHSQKYAFMLSQADLALYLAHDISRCCIRASLEIEFETNVFHIIFKEAQKDQRCIEKMLYLYGLASQSYRYKFRCLSMDTWIYGFYAMPCHVLQTMASSTNRTSHRNTEKLLVDDVAAA